MMYSLGIDLGTSGIRAVVMDAKQQLLAQSQAGLPDSLAYYTEQDQTQNIGFTQNPVDWWETLSRVIQQLADDLRSRTTLSLYSITHLAIDGTSGTVLLSDAGGTPLSDALMYNDQRAIVQAQHIKKLAPDDTAAIGSTSGLAKLLWLFENYHSSETISYVLNQADWISGKLMGHYGYSDYNNALKMGYDAQNHCWPEWLRNLLEQYDIPLTCLPKVYTPGKIIGSISPEIADFFGFNPQLKVCAGTTDSTAAIYASGASQTGEAITSLGSTLVMKVISAKPIFDQKSGVYSQPYGKQWLVGGSSNSGGQVLKQLFCPGEIVELTESLQQKIEKNQYSLLDLHFYPLTTPGERFPIQDPTLEAKMKPRPKLDLDYFQALLEGMADIENMSYKRLLELGAPYPKRVISIGGGAFNSAWRHIRQQKLAIPVLLADQEQAAAGTAILAQASW